MGTDPLFSEFKFDPQIFTLLGIITSEVTVVCDVAYLGDQSWSDITVERI